MLDVNNVLLLMFIRLIKTSNTAFFEKLIKLQMYKLCIKSYKTIKQGLLLIIGLKNIFILYEYP